MAAILISHLREQWPFAIETGLVLLAFLIAFLRSDFGNRAFEHVERLSGVLAKKRGLSVIAVILIALIGRGALLVVDPIPAPAVHDEFSYLLLGNTFASGRLTNPAHPMWKHFESFHINQQPTYCSKYPLAQGVFLAFGEAVLGHPWLGVWISAALMCGAICWMLQGWLPAGWALLGGLLAVMRLALFSYWIDSYWGGAAAAIGGCLLLGALARMRRRMRIRDAVWMGAGAAILAISRPYEGLLLCLATAGTLVAWTIRGGAAAWRSLLVRGVIPMLVPLCLTAAFMGFYFQRTTGNAFVSPYELNSRTYMVSPIPFFVWLPLKPAPEYRHPVMSKFYLQYETPLFLRSKSVQGFLRWTVADRIARLMWFFMGPALAVALLAALRTLRDHRVRPLLWIGLFFAIGQAAQSFFMTHYAAPVTGLLLALILQGFRHLRFWAPGGQPVGRFAVRAIPVICFAMVVVRIVHPPGPLEFNRSRLDLWCCTQIGNLAREAVIAKLEELGGKHLVIVRYGPAHEVHDEWVYNAADIDGANVVFAREMDPASDRALVWYFKDRAVWTLSPDTDPGRLTAYRNNPHD
jgi:hypothetical protein